VVQRVGDRGREHARLLELADEIGADLIVVGLPLSLDGRQGPAARGVLDEVAELAARTSLPVRTYDERLTTVSAERALRAGGVKGRARRQVVDKVAAAVMLQAWLDGLPPDDPEPT
jgi:putative Holliday junction resolvase